MSAVNWIGKSIGGRYQIESLLGQGGMSAVYQATDPNLRRTVAIKLIHPHLSTDPEFVRRFEQEAAAVAQLRHAHIIQVYDFNHDADVYYMVLEFVPGETLQARLKDLHVTGQRLPLTEIIRIMATICDAVDYAHRRHMVHRDLKPANVMLDLQNEPILMDFGVAKIVGGQQHTATGAVIGTASYMSPEQVKGQSVDERADIYSLGVMLYEMAAGRPPFEGDSAMTVMFKHLNDVPPDISQFNATVPESLKAVILKALAKEPADRFQRGAEMAAALRSTQSAPVVATVVSPPVDLPDQTSLGPPVASVSAAPLTQTPTMIVKPEPKKSSGVSRPVLIGLGVLLFVVIVGIVGVLLLPPGFPNIFGGNVPTAVAVATATNAGVIVAPTSNTPTVVVPRATPTTAPTSPPPPTATEVPLATPEGMLPIPAGTFPMGSANGPTDEKPTHDVNLSAFFMDEFEVTIGRYQNCVKTQVCDLPATRGSFERAQYFSDPSFAQYPVISVTWKQAATFCTSEGKRLPTEAEWEYAARGTDGRTYPWGNTFDATLVPASVNDTIEAGAIAGNVSPFGIHDLAGNVAEWVADWYGRNYYAEAPVNDPTGPETGTQKVFRGGSFGNPDGAFYTTTRRYRQTISFHDVDIGFRCVADVP